MLTRIELLFGEIRCWPNIFSSINHVTYRYTIFSQKHLSNCKCLNFSLWDHVVEVNFRNRDYTCILSQARYLLFPRTLASIWSVTWYPPRATLRHFIIFYILTLQEPSRKSRFIFRLSTKDQKSNERVNLWRQAKIEHQTVVVFHFTLSLVG